MQVLYNCIIRSIRLPFRNNTCPSVHNIAFTLSAFKCIDSDRDDEETNVQVPTTGTATSATENELPPSSVVDAALAPSFTNKSPISAAQTRCLAMQTKQHEAEMELLDLNKRNLIIAHKRKMEVLDAELQYWDMMKQSIQSTQEEVHKPNTRARKQH